MELTHWHEARPGFEARPHLLVFWYYGGNGKGVNFLMDVA